MYWHVALSPVQVAQVAQVSQYLRRSRSFGFADDKNLFSSRSPLICA